MTKRGLLLTCTVTLLGASAAADAQDASQPRETVETLEEVIVTAQKRSENLQDVPVAVTALTAELRDTIGITTAQDIATFTPSMSFGGERRLYLRGVGRTTLGVATDPGVAVYHDNFYIPEAAFVTQDAVVPQFAERVEILRGPQGTLYGRNTAGGALNVISKRPTDYFAAELRQEITTYEQSMTSLSLSGPLSDTVSARVNALGRYLGDGYVENLAGPDPSTGHSYLLDPQIEWRPNDDFSLWARYTANRAKVHFGFPLIDPYETTSPTMLGGLQPNPTFGYETPNPGVADHRKIREGTPSVADYNLNDYAIVQAEWNLGGSSLRYVGGWAKRDLDIVQDYDHSDREGYLSAAGTFISAVDLAGIDVYQTYYSNELNWYSNGEGAVDWIFGLYQYHDENGQEISLYRPYQPELTDLDGRGVYFNSRSDIDIDSYAAFSQLDWHLTDTFTLQTGVRYTYDEKDENDELGRIVMFIPDTITLDLTPFAGGRLPTQSGDWDSVTGRVALQYQPDEQTTLFALVATGYKSGAFSNDPLTNEQLAIDSEELIDYEIGLKKDFGDSLRLNTAVFYYDYTDMQVTTTALDAVGAPTQVLVNAPKARSYGLEVEASWSLTQHWRAMLAYSYLNAEFEELQSIDLANTAAGMQDLAGGPVPQSPKNKVGFNLLYTTSVARGDLALSASYSYASKQYYDIFPTALNVGRAHDEVDLRATWTSPSGRYSIIGDFSNVFDEEWNTFTDILGDPNARRRSYTLNDPRRASLQFVVKW